MSDTRNRLAGNSNEDAAAEDDVLAHRLSANENEDAASDRGRLSANDNEDVTADDEDDVQAHRLH